MAIVKLLLAIVG